MCPAGLRVAGGARAERWKLSHSPSSATKDARPLMPSSCLTAAALSHLLDLLAQLPDPRKRRGRRHSLAGLLAVGIGSASRRCLRLEGIAAGLGPGLSSWPAPG